MKLMAWDASRRRVAYAEEQRRAGQRAMLWDGGLSRTMDALSGGVILAGFALALGATDAQIGLLAAIPFLGQLANLPAVAIMQRFPDRKPLVVWGSVAARLLLFAIAALPLVAARGGPMELLIPILVAYAVLATLSGAGWQVWVRELVPRERLGAYFGRRFALISLVGLVTVPLAGAFVTWFGHGLVAYSVLFALGGVAGLASSLVLARAPSVPSAAGASKTFREVAREPFADANYRRLLVFLAAWGFAANLATPFVSIVLMRTLGYSVLAVALLASLSQLAYIVGMRMWAPLTDRYGNKPVLGLGASVFLVAIAGWAATPKVANALALVSAIGLHVVLGFANAALDVASNGVVLKLAREDELPSYLASASVVKAVAAGVAPLVGGLALTLLGDRAFSVQLSWSGAAASHAVTALRIAQHDFLFVACVLFGLYAVHRLLGFREEGEAPPETVARAMRRELQLPTSIAGLRAFAHVASYLVEAAYRFT
jgi:MFS family permease